MNHTPADSEALARASGFRFGFLVGLAVGLMLAAAVKALGA